ncbi:restriction endonuclease subunit S [Aeromonas hydrophila]|uniref:restriction endonuclease subunit S n=1 Tax=Aeromonas hydrophila TaxID=644 RepID=UPI0030DAB346
MAFTMTVSELIEADKSGLLGKHATWERVPLAQVASILNGAPFNSSSFSNDAGVPLVRIRDVLTGRTNTYYNGVYDKIFLVKAGDLLVGMDGDFNSNFWGSQTALLNQRVCKITPNVAFYDKKFLAYALPGYLSAINKNTSSITVKHLSSKTIGDIDLPLPPRAEQTRIVTKLEELLTDLDAGMAELKTAQKKLAQYRQSLLKAAVEGGLTTQWREDKPATDSGAQLLDRILLERRAHWEAKQLAKFAEQGKKPPKEWQKKYPEPVQPDTTNLPPLPEGWVWATISQLATIGTGVTPLKSKSQYYVDGDIPWVTSGALNNEIVTEAIEYVTPLAIKECRLELYPAGALLIAMYGEGKTRGKCSELAISATINQAIAALVFEDSALACKQYLKYFLLKSYDDMRNQASGGVQPNLNLQIIRSISVPIPPLDEQHTITNILSEQLEATKDQDAAIERSLQQSTVQRQNILRAAFAGQLVLQDQNDEPASSLLERIKVDQAERKSEKKARNIKRSDLMNKPLAEHLREFIKDSPENEFSFETFKRFSSGDYETVKNAVFQVLAAEEPIIEQIFDSQSGTILFRKVMS